MDIDIAAVAAAGGTALIDLMISDAWEEAKSIALRVFRRNRDDDDPTVSDDLENTRTEIIDARQSGNSQRETELTAEWSSRFRRESARNPEVAQNLTKLLELRDTAMASGSDNATNIAVARDSSRVYQQGSGVQNNY